MTKRNQPTMFGIIKVDVGRTEPLNLTFTSEEVYSETLRRLRKQEKYRVLDSFFGYQISNSVESAMELLDVFAR